MHLMRLGTLAIFLCPDPFDPWQQLALWSGDAAAVAIFMGRVRPSTMDGRPLEALELEHFPGLCERQITAMAQRLQQEHRTGPILVLHRVGKLAPGEPIVLVAVQADRRGAAQRCAAALLEQLKHRPRSGSGSGALVRAPGWRPTRHSDQGVGAAAGSPAV